jgi:hypothetical protein
VVYSRENCPLCDELLGELGAWLAARAPGAGPVTLDVLDVDGDPVAQRRHGLKVPVLLLDGVIVCHGHFDVGALTRLLSR